MPKQWDRDWWILAQLHNQENDAACLAGSFWIREALSLVHHSRVVHAALGGMPRSSRILVSLGRDLFGDSMGFPVTRRIPKVLDTAGCSPFTLLSSPIFIFIHLILVFIPHILKIDMVQPDATYFISFIPNVWSRVKSQDPSFCLVFRESRSPIFVIYPQFNTLSFEYNGTFIHSIGPPYKYCRPQYLISFVYPSVIGSFWFAGNLPLFVMIFLAVWTSMGDQGYESLTKCDDLPNIPSQSHYTSTIIISPWRKQGKTVKPCKVCRCIPWIPMIIIWLVPLIVPLFPQSWPIVSPIPGKINNFTVFPHWNDD